MQTINTEQTQRSHSRPFWPSLALALALFALGSFAAQAATWPSGYTADKPGLTVDSDGQVIMHGSPYRGIGVNFYDCWLNLLAWEDNSYANGLQTLRDYNIQYGRFMLCGFWPIEVRKYVDDPTNYFRLMDSFIQSCERENIGIIACLFWCYNAIPDIVGEHMDEAYDNPNSQTYALMSRYIQDMVERYKNSPAIWAWECSNEQMLGADLPNASEFLPSTLTELGCPSTRDPTRDTMPSARCLRLFNFFATQVRLHDSYRLISTGNGFPRDCAWNNTASGSWDPDTKAQYQSILLRDNPNPYCISVHYYGDGDGDRRWADVQATSLSLMQTTMETAASAKKPLFVGEFGFASNPDGSLIPNEQVRFAQYLNVITSCNVPLACVWQFHGANGPEWNIEPNLPRSYQLEQIRDTNGAYAQRPYGGTPRTIPGTIEAEDFDTGGEGVASHETDSLSVQYRPCEGVDIEPTSDTGGGYNVGWINSGEWLEYTMNVTAGTYNLTFRVAATSIGGQITALLDGTVLGTVAVPNTGGWQTWTDVALTGKTLTGGNGKVLRLEFTTGGFNLNKMVIAANLPVSAWVNADIGSPGVAGSASLMNGTFTIRASGTDIWGTSDQFHFVSQPSGGDCSIIARVLSIQNTSAWAKSGVMIRASTAANAMNAGVFVTPGNGITFQWRSATGGISAYVGKKGLVAPYWVKLTRTGNSFAASYSSNGTSWTALGTARTIPMASDARIGLAATSLNNTTLGTSTIGNVTVIPGLVGPVGYTYCAAENQSYALSGTCDVAYGANGLFNYLYGKTGTITFNNATFGDPIPGVVKKGYYKVK